jgi:predicted NAD/FAD-binding protein
VSRLRVAVTGTGISGLGAAHFLHPRVDLTLFEQDAHVGGHSNTLSIDEGGRRVPFDTGFMVFNRFTYPNLTRLFAELGVATKPTSMSFSVQHLPSDIEYNGTGFGGLFGQRRNLLRPSHWRMLSAIARFNREAVEALADPRWESHTLASYVALRGYGAEFLERYLVPMGAAVWSTAPEQMLEFPAMTLLRFWHNHGFLGMRTHHQWYTVVDGAEAYVARLTAPFADRIRQNERVVQVSRRADGVQLTTAKGETHAFDKVILACHADQALAMLGDPTPDERRLLGAFRYSANETIVHTDASVMPRTRRCWASWNYRVGAGAADASTHYWMNNLQGLETREPIFVSLNARALIAPEKIIRTIDYAHPLFDRAAVAAQAELPRLNAVVRNKTTYFAGAWFKYGFHEDGFTSGLECARALAGEAFWT